jgi:hypothetical protein
MCLTSQRPSFLRIFLAAVAATTISMLWQSSSIWTRPVPTDAAAMLASAPLAFCVCLVGYCILILGLSYVAVQIGRLAYFTTFCVVAALLGTLDALPPQVDEWRMSGHVLVRAYHWTPDGWLWVSENWAVTIIIAAAISLILYVRRATPIAPPTQVSVDDPAA